MVIRSRLPRVKLGWNPFKDEKTQLLEKFNEAVNAEDPQNAQLCYEELKIRGFI
jgi:hypothetical protein